MEATECKHCSGQGTCETGKDGNSCLDCAKKTYFLSSLRSTRTLCSTTGLVCKQCEGSGLFDPRSRRLHRNMKPVLALLVVVFALFIVLELALKQSPHLNEVLPFVSALAGSVITYYFSTNETGRGHNQ